VNFIRKTAPGRRFNPHLSGNTPPFKLAASGTVVGAASKALRKEGSLPDQPRARPVRCVIPVAAPHPAEADRRHSPVRLRSLRVLGRKRRSPRPSACGVQWTLRRVGINKPTARHIRSGGPRATRLIGKHILSRRLTGVVRARGAPKPGDVVAALMTGEHAKDVHGATRQALPFARRIHVIPT